MINSLADRLRSDMDSMARSQDMATRLARQVLDTTHKATNTSVAVRPKHIVKAFPRMANLSSSSFNDNEPSAARASSAPDAKTVELSPPLVLGRGLSLGSSFPEPTVAIAELAARFGMNLSTR